MIKFVFISTLLFFSNYVLSNLDTSNVNFEKNEMYYLQSKENKKLIIFLHGGIRNPFFKNNNSVSLDYLIEGNDDFIHQAEKNNFDLIIPITNNSLNWLTNYEYCFNIFDKYINSLSKSYDKVYISGFSDGGTGSYKIFYSHLNKFDGLISFNGYPNHNNFNQNIDYSQVKNKKIIFCGGVKDKRIEYEFSLVEYCKQKKYNPNTFIYIINDKHLFSTYDKNKLATVFKILTSVENKKTDPIQGLIINDELIEFYKYRKKIIRKYHYGIEFYKINKEQRKAFANKNNSFIKNI